MSPPSSGLKYKPCKKPASNRQLGLFFNPEDGGYMFLQNTDRLSANYEYMALYPRRENSKNMSFVIMPCNLHVLTRLY
jgi:hypothetical protein